MKKKMLVTLLTASMVAASLAGCGKTEEAAPAAPAATEEKAEAAEEAPAAEEAAADVDYGTGEITIWVADAVTSFTEAKVAEFQAANPEYAGYTVTVEAVGEGDAAGNMITDVEGGADIYGFAQDQLTRLVSAGALTPVTGDNAATVTANNDAGSVAAATVGGTIFAYPMTSDNGYFLYYDSSVVTDASTLESVIAGCEAAGKNFYMEINSGWYQTAFFFGTGAELTYDTDDTGAFTACNTTYASEAGVVAAKEMIEVASSPAFQNGSSISDGTNVGAIVDGTWDSEAAKEVFGDNYACSKLPTFTGSDGKEYQMSGFGGFKLLGVKPQEDAGKLAVCNAIASYLTGEEVQLARYNEVGWGPSNLNAQGDSAVQADEALSALAEQLAYTIPQGQYPGDYWSLATSFGDDIIANGVLTTSSSDEDIMAALNQFADTCISYAQ